MIRKDKVIEDFHGTLVADPYRWLEDEESPETKAWWKEQDASAREFLADLPQREDIRERLEEVFNYTRYHLPSKSSDAYYFQRQKARQDQPVLYRTEELDGDPRVVLDPNALSDDGTVALMNYTFSKDGRYMAYGCSQSGSDRQIIRVRDLETNEDLDDAIQHCKFTPLPWMPDSSGFFYSRFPEPGTVPEEDVSNYSKVYFHRLGTPQADDPVIFENPDKKEEVFRPHVTEDGKYLLLNVSIGTQARNRVYVRAIGDCGNFIRLLDENDAQYLFIGSDDDVLYFQTDCDADASRIIGIDINNPEREHWQEIIPERDDAIAISKFAGGHFAVVYRHHAHSQLKIFDGDGELVDEVDLPTLGTIWELSGSTDDSELFFDFTSYLYPRTVFQYDLESRECEMLWTPEVDFDIDEFETKQVFCTSKDGTRVPMFITCRKDLELDGDNRTLLYGYGGFNSGASLNFSPSLMVWMERGGVYVHACMRGGSEYGREWHEAGMFENKQNVFDDFIAAGEWLVDNDYTSTDKLAIMGASNGGLLVAACMLQRPDLYGAVICRVPVIDMLRFHRFTVGRFWTTEYGNAEENAEDFEYMFRYSPMHNVRCGVVYPPLLIMTADHDDRVVPSHAMKFAATLQDVAVSDNPILLRVETKAGHGAGKPVSKVIGEDADIYAFLEEVM